MDSGHRQHDTGKGAVEMQPGGANEARSSHGRIGKTRGRQNAANAARKKAQNRCAQRSFREKQTAYVQYLESFVETVKANDFDSNGNKLLRAHLDLLDGYRQLHDAFLRLRQKLRSLGQSATAAADEDTFDIFAKGFERHDSQPLSLFDISRQEGNGQLGHTAISDPQIPTVPTYSQDFTLSTAAIHNQDAISTNTNDDLFSYSHFLSDSTITASLITNKSSSNIVQQAGTVASCSEKLVLVKSKALLADKVEAACKRYLAQSIESHSVPGEQPPSHGQLSLSESRLLQPVSSAAISLIAGVSGLGLYIYGSSFYKCLEATLQWRLCNTVESRLAIPEPFRPTPLQYTSIDHHIIIDFISWPCIRDQMILQCRNLDLDALCRDLTLHTVVDVPERQLAVGVYDYLREKTIQGEQMLSPVVQSCLDSPDWPYLQISPSSPFAISLDPAEDLIIQELETRLQNPMATFDPHVSLSDSFGGGLFRTETARASQSSRVDVRQPSEWKLSRDFTCKWPFIDCSSGKNTVLLRSRK